MSGPSHDITCPDMQPAPTKAYEDESVMHMLPGPRDKLIDNGQQKSTNRLLVLVPHERSHGLMRTMRIMEPPCMLLPKALKMRAKTQRHVSLYIRYALINEQFMNFIVQSHTLQQFFVGCLNWANLPC